MANERAHILIFRGGETMAGTVRKIEEGTGKHVDERHFRLCHSSALFLDAHFKNISWRW